MIKTIDEIRPLIKNLKSKNKKVVFTNGCFDILHTGHIKILKEAKSFGDVLIIGLNSDYSVRILKGNSRPLNNEKDRAEILSSLRYVDFVVLFSERTPINLIKEIKPDVLVKGQDYSVENVCGADFVQSYGGEVKLVELEKGKSTSKIVDEIKSDK